MYWILRIVLYALYSILCILQIVIYALYYMHCIIGIALYILYSVHCTLCIEFGISHIGISIGYSGYRYQPNNRKNQLKYQLLAIVKISVSVTITVAAMLV